jgi:pimeloyl-ACP methyl ester carboxylesterase
MADAAQTGMAAFSPGQSPPPVSRPMRIGGILLTGQTGPCYTRVGCASEMASRQNRRVVASAGAVAAAALAGTLAQRQHMRRVSSDPEDAFLRNPPAGRPLTARSKDGTRLHAELFGPDDAQTIVLAHGWTEMRSYWAYVIRDLSPRFRVVAYDLRGHGDSEAAAGGDYSIDRFGEDVEAVLEAGVPAGRRAVVVGHSLGAMSIAAWAQDYHVDRRAAAAALLNTGVGDLMAENLLIPVPWIAQAMNRALPPTRLVGGRTPMPRFSTPGSNAVIRYVAFGPAATPAQVAFYERMLVACPPDVRAEVGIALTELELYEALPRLTVPTIVIAGAGDRLTPPSHAERIARALPQLRRLIVLPDTGHMAPLERHRLVSSALGELAADVASETPAAAA